MNTHTGVVVNPETGMEELIGITSKEDGLEPSKPQVPDVKTAPHAQTVEWLYTGIKSMVKENTLYADDIAVLAGLTTELYQQMKEPQKEMTDSDLDDMLWDARH